MLLFCFSVDGGNAVGKIIFLKARAMKKDAATLVASGPQGTNICYRTNLSHSSLGPRQYPPLQCDFTESVDVNKGYTSF